MRRLAEKGAKVVIADVSDERGEALAREVGAGFLYVPTDCMDEDAIAKAVNAAAGLGPLRAAVITHIGPDWPGGRGPPYRARKRAVSAPHRSLVRGDRTRYDEKGQLVLIGRRGRDEVPVEGMSDATRDQLYLALRIAALEQHFRANGPMPVVADDLLINFDDRRPPRRVASWPSFRTQRR